MSLPSLQLDAFLEVARTASFSKAARNLNLTQSAFSQRILNLESEMEVSLLIRDPSGVRLTEAGQRLLRYCQTKTSLEKEMLGEIHPKGESPLEGVISIGAYSSVFRSVLIPALTGLVKESPRIRVESFVREVGELPGLLRSSEAEFVLLDTKLDRQGIESHLLGHETYVMVEPKAPFERNNVYLDHDAEDRTTELFLKAQGQGSLPYERSFLGDIYGVMAGVEAGWGRAVLPGHLIRDNRRLKVLRTKKELRVPVYLTYYAQPFYTKLHDRVVNCLLSGCRALLG